MFSGIAINNKLKLQRNSL